MEKEELYKKLDIIKDKLKKSYGTDDIDIQNGVINYKKDEQTDKKD